jgi:hypothetical protein
MRRVTWVFSILVVVALIASCTTFQVSGVQMNRETPSYESVGQFEVSVPVHELLGGSGGANLANITAASMDEKIFDTISREIAKFSGDAAVNVTIEYQATFIDLLLNGLTAGIYAPAHAKISGTVVKFQ